MKRFFIAIVFCLLLYACKPGIPKTIIQPDQMEKVLYDIHIVDGYITTFPNADSAKKVASPLYKGIYKKFRIDSALYNQSMDYYYKHPDLMKKMYDHITLKLTKAKDKAIKLAKPVAAPPIEAKTKPIEAKPTKLVDVKPIKRPKPLKPTAKQVVKPIAAKPVAKSIEKKPIKN